VRPFALVNKNVLRELSYCNTHLCPHSELLCWQILMWDLCQSPEVQKGDLKRSGQFEEILAMKSKACSGTLCFFWGGKLEVVGYSTLNWLVQNLALKLHMSMESHSLVHLSEHPMYLFPNQKWIKAKLSHFLAAYYVHQKWNQSSKEKKIRKNCEIIFFWSPSNLKQKKIWFHSLPHNQTAKIIWVTWMWWYKELASICPWGSHF
jgi:hypothetical protein